MREIRYSDAVREALAAEMERDPNVVLLGEDIGVYGGAFGVTAGLLERFGPDRVVDTPISENSFVGLAVGAAVTGLRPVVEIMFMDFIALAMDQIINHASKLRYMYDGQVSVPMVIRTPAGAGRGYGPSHSQNLEHLFVGVPGLRVVVPYTPLEAKGLLVAAIRDGGPVLFVENKLLYGESGPVPKGEAVLPLGRARVLREGDDVTIVSLGRMLNVVREAVSVLEEKGISPEVVNLVSVNPIDTESIVASVEKTSHLVIVEEGVRSGGVGAEVAACVAELALEYLDGPIVRVGLPDVPVPSSPDLEQMVLPNAADVVAAVKRTRATG